MSKAESELQEEIEASLHLLRHHTYIGELVKKALAGERIGPRQSKRVGEWVARHLLDVRDDTKEVLGEQDLTEVDQEAIKEAIDSLVKLSWSLMNTTGVVDTEDSRST